MTMTSINMTIQVNDAIMTLRCSCISAWWMSMYRWTPSANLLSQVNNSIVLSTWNRNMILSMMYDIIDLYILAWNKITRKQAYPYMEQHELHNNEQLKLASWVFQCGHRIMNRYRIYPFEHFTLRKPLFISESID